MLNNLGALSLGQVNFAQSETYYQRALIIRQELNQPQYLLEDWVGLALISWQQGDAESAQAYADKLLNSWNDNPAFEGTENQMQTLHFVWQLFRALGLVQASSVLATAVKIMRTYLNNQPDLAAETVYLGQVHKRPLWAGGAGQVKN